MTNIKIIDLQPVEIELSELSNWELKAILGGCLTNGDGTIKCCEAEYKVIGNRAVLVSFCGRRFPR